MPGYCDPPVESRFKKGQSGNPKGGPRGPRKKKSHSRTGYLNQFIKCRIAGKRFEGRRGEALMRVASRLAIEKKDFVIQQLLFKLKEQLDQAQSHINPDKPFYVVREWPSDLDVVECLEDAADVSGFGKKAYRKQKTGRVLLENWVIEEAFANLGERRLTRDEQEMVLAAVRLPKTICWPEWWEADLCQRGKSWRAKQNVEFKSVRKEPDTIRISLAQSLANKRKRELERDRLEHERYNRENPGRV